MTIEEVIVEFVRSLPAWLRYPVTALCFWPAALKTRIIYWLWPEYRQLWNRVPGTLVIVGTVPMCESDVRELVRNEGVRCIINLCREWMWHKELYELLGVKALWLPTVDFDPPSLEDTLRGVEAIAAAAARGESTYVHCKAGRGRSVCIVLAYLILHHGLSPREADQLIRSARPHISKKWNLPLFDVIWRMAKEKRNLITTTAETTTTTTSTTTTTTTNSTPATVVAVLVASTSPSPTPDSPIAIDSDTAPLVSAASRLQIPIRFSDDLTQAKRTARITPRKLAS
jgi:atypical dual specificity phosphatase